MAQYQVNLRNTIVVTLILLLSRSTHSYLLQFMLFSLFLVSFGAYLPNRVLIIAD